jgi:hypothetical protein
MYNWTLWECQNVALFWFVMKEGPVTNRITLVAGIASLVGPACVVLPYTDYLPVFRSTGLRGRVAVGSHRVQRHWHRRFSFSKGSKVAGTICVLTNIPALAYWGFIGFFSPWVDRGELCCRKTVIQTGRIRP